MAIAENAWAPKAGTVYPRPDDIDRFVGKRMRSRRALMGLSLHQMAHMIGVTYQQVQKYETGINRVISSRLYQIATSLEVDVDFFFYGVNDASHLLPLLKQPLLLKLARHFLAVDNPSHQELICDLARSLANEKLVT